jgi:hypothetical protein
VNDFQNLNVGIGPPGVDKGGADGFVLFDANSTSATSAIVQVGPAPVVLKAYNLQAGQSIAVNNIYTGSGAVAPYMREGVAVVLNQNNTAEILFLAGSYQLVFTGSLGTLVVTATALNKPRLPGDGTTLASLRSETSSPNPLFGGVNNGVLSPKFQVGAYPCVFRAYGLGAGQVVQVMNVYTKDGVDTVQPLIVSGVAVTLTNTNNNIVLSLAGTYQFQLTAPIAGLLLIGHETSAQYLDPYTLEESEAAATQAAASALSASNSATASQGSATAAAASAVAAANSASAAQISAGNAADSATAADASATEAATSATASADSATASATSASDSADSATASATSATAAADSATAAAASDTDAQNQAAAAQTSATNAADSATAAAGSATTADTDATNAGNSATVAQTSATNAAASATTAQTQATNAGNSATNAATSANAAASSASGSAASASGASTSATNATNSATASQNSATASQNSATAAAASAASVRLHAEATISSAAGVVTIDLSQNIELYHLTLSENVTSWVFNNKPAVGKVAEITVAVKQGATVFTCVSPASAGQTAGGPWTASAVAAKEQWLDLVINSSGNIKMLPEAILG